MANRAESSGLYPRPVHRRAYGLASQVQPSGSLIEQVRGTERFSGPRCPRHLATRPCQSLSVRYVTCPVSLSMPESNAVLSEIRIDRVAILALVRLLSMSRFLVLRPFV